MRNEPKSSKSTSKSPNPKQNQQILLIVLLVLVCILGFELMRGRLLGKKKGKANEPVANAVQDTTKKDVDKKISAEDSISRVYAPAVFRQEQMKQQRVKDAFKLKGDTLQKLYKKAGLDANSLNIYIRAFKKEQVVEVWGADKNTDAFKLIRTYKFCKTSGKLGPKRKAGDDQIPEGFYKIDRFNPQSRYHLSLGLNYPNKVDKKLGDTTDLGNDIFIHGGCATIGCIPITDDKIKELYLMAIDARSAGQKNISVTIFPARLTEEGMRSLKVQHQDEPANLKFWASLRKGFQYFEDCKRLPSITLTEKGEYICKSACGGD
jgi:murein L,D-transpeptidase YafK